MKLISFTQRTANRLVWLFFLVLSGWAVTAQTVTGVITDEDTGDPLIGVTVLEEGTTNGTVSDVDGSYSLTLTRSGSTLVYSFVGYATQRIAYTGQSPLNVAMALGSDLDEVVVTSLGISREKKALTYAAQNVKAGELSQARDLNVVNGLSGKVAGLSIARSGAGVGAESRVILRGNRSLAGNSQPLFIVDGVPILGDITDINPDDIESVSVLKGANAAALYGSRAQNGAIIITTKSGKEGFKVSLNTSYTAESPLILRKYQTQFGQGNTGVYTPNSEQAWGPALDGRSVTHWSPDPNFPEKSYSYSANNPVEDFFQTGHNLATSLAITGGTAKSQTYFSYTYTDAAGVVPTNELTRHNVHLRMTNQVTNKLTLDAKLNYIREDLDNPLSQGEDFSNPSRHAYRLLPNIRTADLEKFEYTAASGAIRQHYWNPGSNGGANPYWSINRNPRWEDTDRVIGLVSLKYNIVNNLNLLVRSAMDRRFIDFQRNDYNDSYIIANNGRFAVSKAEAMEWNTDLLLSYEKKINDDLFFNINAGANARKERNSGLSSNTGVGLTVPNFFALANTQVVVSSNNVGAPKDVNSVYAFGQLGWKNAIYLDVTARNDWSSTLPVDNNSYFYPSVGISAVLSDLFELPEFFSYIKLRGSLAQVGNDTSPYLLERTANLAAGGANGFLTLSSTLPNEDLKPEKTTSLELGTDLRILNNKVGLDFTYYKANTRDQLFSIALPIGSGASQFFTNGGDVQNSGIEAILSYTPINNKDFRWDIGFNFTRNTSKVLSINDQRPRISVGSDFLREFFIEQGQPWGNVYSRGFQRDAQGRVIVGANGLPRITAGRTVNVANFNPDWLGGISNSLSWKDLSFSFLIDIRQGGSTASLTDAIIFGDGLVEETLQGRDGSLIFGENFYGHETAVKEDGTPNNLKMNAEAFWQLVGGRNAPVGEVFSVDASNVRVRELVLGYKLPISGNPIRSARISLVGRNLFFISNKAKTLDPEFIVGTGTASEGFESFAPPSTRSFGLNLQLEF